MAGTSNKADVVIAVQAQVNQALKNLDKVFKKISKTTVSTKTFANLDKNLQKVEQSFNRLEKVKAVNSLGTQLKKNEARFQGWALSVLFFGMAIQRAFLSIWRSSSQAFNEISHSVEGSVTGFDMLNGSLKYLGFVVGQALEPFAQLLVPIIDKIAEWVNAHQEATRWIVATGLAIGTLLFALGFFTLGISGVVTMFRNLNTIIQFVFGTNLGANITKAGGLISWLSARVLALTGATTLWGAVARVVFGGLIIAGIIGLLVWLYKIKDEMGSWPNFFKAIARGVLRVWAFLMASLSGAFAEMWNVVKMEWNNSLTKLAAIINGFIWLIEQAINALRSAVGKKSISLGRVTFEGLKADDIKDFGTSFINTYEDMLKSYLAFEDKYLHIDTAELSGTAAKLAGVKQETDSLVQGVIGTDSSQETSTNGNTTVTNFNNITIEGSDMTVQEVMDELNRQFAGITNNTSGA